MMEEKKLTDEEIVKALDKTKQELANISPEDDDYDKLLTVKTIVDYCHDLIHRLQSVNRWLLDRCKIMDGDIAEQKAEIERLTEERDGYLYDCSAVRHKIRQEIEEKFELQKQVDELTKQLVTMEEQRDNQAYIAEDLIQEKHRWTEHAVKDTAQEALEAFICKLVNSRLVSTKDDLYVEMLETKDDLLKEKYGVEVE
jgi:chromosome segregation ATPase